MSMFRKHKQVISDEATQAAAALAEVMGEILERNTASEGKNLEEHRPTVEIYSAGGDKLMMVVDCSAITQKLQQLAMRPETGARDFANCEDMQNKIDTYFELYTQAASGERYGENGKKGLVYVSASELPKLAQELRNGIKELAQPQPKQ